MPCIMLYDRIMLLQMAVCIKCHPAVVKQLQYACRFTILQVHTSAKYLSYSVKLIVLDREGADDSAPSNIFSPPNLLDTSKKSSLAFF